MLLFGRPLTLLRSIKLRHYFSNNALLSFTNQDAVTQAIIANAPNSGVYFLPYMPERASGMTQEEFDAAYKKAEDQMTNGPFMLASVRLGQMGSYPVYFVIQLITDMLAALFICLILARVQIPYWNRALLSLWVGLAGFAAFSLPQWNWYAFSNAFTFAELVDCGRRILPCRTHDCQVRTGQRSSAQAKRSVLEAPLTPLSKQNPDASGSA